MRPFADATLSRWVRPEDRGIPADLVKRSVGCLLRTDFSELLDAPGVGVTKLTKLIELLERVGAAAPPADRHSNHNGIVPFKRRPSAELAPAVQWANDTELVRNGDLIDLPLGRMAPSLDELPRNLWMTPLARFISLSFDELHGIPYFGTRRITVVREIVAEVARQSERRTSADDRQKWHAPHIRQAAERLSTAKTITRNAVLHDVIKPLLLQLAVDLGPRAVVAASNIIGFDSLTAKDIAGIEAFQIDAISRPRLHQIREDIRLVFQVRWPKGDEALEHCFARLDEADGSVAYLGKIFHLLCGRHLRRRSGMPASWQIKTAITMGGR
jgi:hypothetical protein